jgi:ferredoxin-NADP reductase
MEHIVKIISVHEVTHDVKAFKVTKPQGYSFEPGQATEVSVNADAWREEKRPFTFTGLNDWDHLEFTIKIYSDHEGVTNQLGKLTPGAELIIRDVWGAIHYQGEGYFIAGGAGITPFIAIMRQLRAKGKVGNNELYFSNKTEQDIIIRTELDDIFKDKSHYITTQGGGPHIDKAFLSREIKDFTKQFYICGPDKMVSDIAQALTELGADPVAVVFEK